MKKIKKTIALLIVFALVSFLPVEFSYSNSTLTWSQFARSASEEKLRSISEIMLRKLFDAYNNNDINTMMKYFDPSFTNPQGFKASDLPLALRTVNQLVDNIRLKLEGIDQVIVDRQAKQLLVTVKYRWTRSMTDADTGIVLKSNGQDATITFSIKPEYINGTQTAHPGFGFIREAYAYEGTPTVKSDGWGKENAQKQADKIKQDTGKDVDVAYEFKEKPSGEFEIKYVRSGDALSAKPRKIKGNNKDSEVYKTTKAIFEGKVATVLPAADTKVAVTPAPTPKPVPPATPSAADTKAQISGVSVTTATSAGASIATTTTTTATATPVTGTRKWTSEEDRAAAAAMLMDEDVPPSYTGVGYVFGDSSYKGDFKLNITITDLWGGNQTTVTDPWYNQISNDAGFGLPYVLNGDIRWVFWAYVVNPSVKTGYPGILQLVELTPDPAFSVGANGFVPLHISLGQSFGVDFTNGSSAVTLNFLGGNETAAYLVPFQLTISVNTNCFFLGNSTSPISAATLRSHQSQVQCFGVRSIKLGDILRLDYRAATQRNVSVFLQVTKITGQFLEVSAYVDYTDIANTRSA